MLVPGKSAEGFESVLVEKANLSQRSIGWWTCWISGWLGLGLILSSCATTAPLDPDALAREQAGVESFFEEFRTQLRRDNTDSVTLRLSRGSIHWLKDIRHAAAWERSGQLKDRAFHEALCILAIRLEKIRDRGFRDDPNGLVGRLLLRDRAIRRSFLDQQFGPVMVEAMDRASIGLAKAPRVPVYWFVREDGFWRLDLARSMPLLLQGVESIARQRRTSPDEQALWVLEEFAGLTADERSQL